QHALVCSRAAPTTINRPSTMGYLSTATTTAVRRTDARGLLAGSVERTRDGFATQNCRVAEDGEPVAPQGFGMELEAVDQTVAVADRLVLPETRAIQLYERMWQR
ncbi:MAG: hypothetical protein QNL12_04655, partial [Acidimicrobiia bacterium]|nr:hypothetical protein [Acidimicrobiia bacterium]MDX2466582.1 hypothetical protein [Acidimicrobiia bacterium]